MKVSDWVMLGGGIFLGWMLLRGKCSSAQLSTIAGIYGMPAGTVGVRKPTSPGAAGGIEIFDRRNNAAIMHVLDGDCDKAVAQASTAVAQAAGNRMFATKAYDGSLYVVS